MSFARRRCLTGIDHPPQEATMEALKGRKTRPPDPRDETTDGDW
jgi:hypothetical protein